MSVRLSQFLPLLDQKTRLVRWKPILGGAAVGFVVLFQFSGALATSSISAIVPMRLAALVLCLGSVFLLDDPAAVTVAPVATPLRYRRGLRLILAVPLIAVAWMGQLIYVTRSIHEEPPDMLTIWGLTLELVAMMTMGLAIAALATWWVSEGLGGVAAGPTLLVILGAASFLPHRWTLFPGSMDDPEWSAAHMRWAVVAVVAALLVAYSSRDPAARRLGLVRSRSRACFRPSGGSSSGDFVQRAPR